eukprot:TRINITY_DN33780_c0_g1_i1.p1 TRINITY_DN33780_c0_g1~~TRINITY_DN33780_c0_g1_i1.p1  ORF type:complete len:569 (+),score=90.30 TRINITY_DN33780_c0_g1_i1:62-1768(+)
MLQPRAIVEFCPPQDLNDTVPSAGLNSVTQSPPLLKANGPPQLEDHCSHSGQQLQLLETTLGDNSRKNFGAASFGDIILALSAEHERLQTTIKELTASCDELRFAGKWKADCYDEKLPENRADARVIDVDGISDCIGFDDPVTAVDLKVEEVKAPRLPSLSTAKDMRSFSDCTIRDILSTRSSQSPRYHPKVFARQLQSFLEANWYEPAIALIVIFDVILLGLEADARIHQKSSHGSSVLPVTIFVKLLFLLEIVARFYTYGVVKTISSTVVKLDILVVVCSILEVILTNIFLVDIKKLIACLNIVRFFRLIRVSRTARAFPMFRPLWILVSGLQGSVFTIIWAAILLFTLMYGFAILGAEMIPPVDRVVSNTYDTVALSKFGSLTSSMMSLFQIVTMDDAADVYQPLMQPGSSRFFCSSYFAIFIMTVTIAFMNLVTAAVVEASRHQSEVNRELQRQAEMERQKALIPSLREMFELIDQDGSGEVSMAEIQQCSVAMQNELKSMTKADNLSELFQLLDDDDSGTVVIDEFLDGILKALKSTSGDVMLNLLIRKLLRQVTHLRRNLGR